MNTLTRFLRYIRISTPSCDGTDTTPSTECQRDLARVLADELTVLGFHDVRVSEDCFVYAHLPASPGCESLPCLGLIAHMDTAPSFCGNNVNPQIIEKYNGGEVLLSATGDVLSPAQFPTLHALRGKTLVTADGSTLLGSDDKAGIAEIITACEEIIQRGLAHPRIAVAFTPDEEIGQGVHSFDVAGFGADYAYTVDGGALGELSYENFNACGASVHIRGTSVHPGSAKDTMVNAVHLGTLFNAALPLCETPRDTQGYEGYFHLEEMQGNVEQATLSYIIRDHNAQRFEGRKEQLLHIEKIFNHRYGERTVHVEIHDQYRNMLEKIQPHFHLIENARAAMRAAGMQPVEIAMRGGTDGAQLCYMGLPCPNLCTGGFAFHGKYEHIAAEDMDACARMLIELIQLYAA